MEIPQRALSPGNNDPTTALYYTDRLGEAFGRMAGRDLPSPLGFDGEGRLRVMIEVLSFDELACPPWQPSPAMGSRTPIWSRDF